MKKEQQDEWEKIVSAVRTNTTFAQNNYESNYNFAICKWDASGKIILAITHSTYNLLINFCRVLVQTINRYRNLEIKQFINIIIHEQLIGLVNNPNMKINGDILISKIDKALEIKNYYYFGLSSAKLDFEDECEISNGNGIGKISFLKEKLKETEDLDLYDKLVKYRELGYIKILVLGPEDRNTDNIAVMKAKEIVNELNYVCFNQNEPFRLITNYNNLNYRDLNDYFLKSQNNFCGNSYYKQFQDQKPLITRKHLSKLNSLIKKSKKSEQGRINLKCINWLGESLQEPNINSAFLDVSIALECIAERKSEKISIEDQLKNFVIKVLEIPEERRNILNKEINTIYRFRSNIVHDGFFELKESDYWNMFELVDNLISRLLNKEPFRDIKDIWSWINIK